MTDGGSDLDAFVRRTRATLSGAGDLSAANTDLRIVLPLLKTLGWDVHGAEVVADHRVTVTDATDDRDAVTVDYALTLDGRPTALVVSTSTDTDLDQAHARRLGVAMTAADVDRGLLTNGRSFVFVAAEDDTLRQVQCSLDELPERESLLSLYTRRAARRRRRQRRARDRRRAADLLRDRREDTVDRITDALTDDVPAPVADELATAAADFVDATTEALAEGVHPRDDAADAVSSPEDDPKRSIVDQSPPAEDGQTTTSPDVGADDPSAPPTADGSPAASERTTSETTSDNEATAEDSRGGTASMARNEGDDEYVARFFDGRSSVGAVGTATAAGAVAQTVQYLVDRHALDNRLDLPWVPEDVDAVDDSTAVVNRAPVHPDGDRMTSPRQIANGYHVETAMDTDAARAVVESLADRSGLRVMFQGGW